MLDLAVFSQLLERISGTALILDLFKHGEPLLNPQLPEMIELAQSKGVRCRVNTALNVRVDDAYLSRLCSSGLYKVICALDGTTQEVYEIYRRGGNLTLALRNAQRLLQTRRQLGRGPKIIYRMLVFEWNHSQVEAARVLAQRLGFDRFQADGGVSVREGAAVRWNVKRSCWEPAMWFLGSTLNSPPAVAAPVKAAKPCASLLGHFVLHADGRSAVCCHSHQEGWLHESLLNHSLEECWNTEAYRNSRAFTVGLSGDRKGVLPQCRSCCWL
jgi:hypothetical protein